MTPPSEKLAGSLDVLRSFQERGIVAVRARDLSPSHRERSAYSDVIAIVTATCRTRCSNH